MNPCCFYQVCTCAMEDILYKAWHVQLLPVGFCFPCRFLLLLACLAAPWHVQLLPEGFCYSLACLAAPWYVYLLPRGFLLLPGMFRWSRASSAAPCDTLLFTCMFQGTWLPWWRAEAQLTSPCVHAPEMQNTFTLFTFPQVHRPKLASNVKCWASDNLPLMQTIDVTVSM